MNLYFVRHGETEHNKNKCYYGRTNISITETGIIQSKKVLEILKDINFNKVYLSDMKRAEETADIITNNRGYNTIKDSRINERDFGVFEGKNYDEIRELYPDEWKLWCEDWKNTSPPKGESCVEVYSRVKDFMDDILKSNEENILIVTHSGVIRSVYCYVLGSNIDFFWKFGSKNGDITVLKYEYKNLYIDSIIHV